MGFEMYESLSYGIVLDLISGFVDDMRRFFVTFHTKSSRHQYQIQILVPQAIPVGQPQ